MISIQPTTMHRPANGCTNDLPKIYYVEQNKDSNKIDKSLLVLAMLGLSMLVSCSKDDYTDFENGEKNPAMDIVQQTNRSPENNLSTMYSYERTDNILNALGLLTSDTASVKNVSTISCTDDRGVKHWIKPNRISDYQVTGQGLDIDNDDPAKSQYNFFIKNAGNGGVNFIKMYTDGSTEILNYLLNEDGSVVESECIDNEFLLEKSVYRKQYDGKIEQTFTNGEKVIYNNICNNNPYPTPIDFDANVEDYQSKIIE